MRTKKYWILIAILGICAGAVLAATRSAGKIATSKQIVRLMTTDPIFYESDAWRNMKQQTLASLNAIGLVIVKRNDSFLPPRTVHSIETGALRTMIVKKLKMAGFRLLSTDELLSEPGSPLLVVGISTRGPTYKDYYTTEQGKTAGTNWGYGGDCYIRLRQEQFLARDKDTSNYGITWSGKSVELKWAKTTDELEESIKEATVQALNYFIVAHIAANQRPVDIGQK